jgi:regulator of replication initiation timing
MADTAAPELARWLADGQRFFGLCLELLEKSNRLQTRAHTLETENEMLREEVARLRHRIDLLQIERTDMVAAFNDLAGHVTQVVDHILLKSEDGETEKGQA